MRDIQDDLKSLDELIAKLGGEDEGIHSVGPCALLVEHLEAARRDRLGAMPMEYALSLEQAFAALRCIPDPQLRAEFAKTLRMLHTSTRSPAPVDKPLVAASEHTSR